MYEKAISTILDYVNENLFEAENLAEQSRFRWAAYEIISRLIEQETMMSWDFHRALKTPIEIITEFISEMEYFSEKSSNKYCQIVFDMAKEGAEVILLLFS